MTYNRFSSNGDNVIVQGNYNSDGNWCGEGPAPKKEPAFWHMTNHSHTAVIEELVALASKHTGLGAVYRREAQQLNEMDSADVAEAYDNGYKPNGSDGAIFCSAPIDTDMGPFWRELERLEALIHIPLNEPVLNDDYLVIGGYMYIVNGKLTECEHFNGESNKGITVAEFKRRYGFQEVKHCDLVGRQLRLPERKERAPAGTLAHRWKSDGRTIRQAKRRPRTSNKIKKVK